MKKATLREKLRFNIDKMMAKGTVYMVLMLSFITFFAVLLIAVAAVLILKKGGPAFGGVLWETFLNILDPGTIAGVENTQGYLVFMCIATIMGLLMTSVLIGLITSGFQAKIEEMQRGKSKVIVSNHSLILGWDNTIFTIISELIIANENQKKPYIVIMADRDITEMQTEMQNYIPSFKNTSVIFRRGCSYDKNDLNMCNVSASKSVIVLDKNDAQKLKVLMALSNTSFFSNSDNHVVVLFEEEESFEVAEIISKDSIVCIDLKDTVSKMIAQTSTQPGLVAVYKDIISFAGDEIYFNNFPEAEGKTFREILFYFEKSSVIGLHRDGECFLRPDLDIVLKKDDSIILITEDDDTAIYSEKAYEISEDCIVAGEARKAHLEESILIVGYNNAIESIIKELEGYLSGNSNLILYFPIDQKAPASLKKVVNESSLSIQIMNGEIPDGDAFEKIVKAGYSRIVLLSSATQDANKTDSDVLLSLLYLRKISDSFNINLSIIGEITDVRNSEIAQSTRYHDFIVSSNICGMISTQLCENKLLKPILDDILDEKDSEIYTKPVKDYVKCGKSMNYYTLVHSAMLKGELCIGYMVCKGDNYKYVMNPRKSSIVQFKEEDCVIVVSEE